MKKKEKELIAKFKRGTTKKRYIIARNEKQNAPTSPSSDTADK